MTEQGIEQGLIELQTRFAYQEQTLQVLSEAVARQQKQIEALEACCRQLLDRVARGAESGWRDQPADEVPPHY